MAAPSGHFVDASVSQGGFEGDSGDFACAVRRSGPLACWGDINPGFGYAIPAGMPGHFLQVSAGPDFVCALKSDHTMACWGATPTAGEFVQISEDCGLTAGHVIECGQYHWSGYRYYSLADSGGYNPNVRDCGIRVDGSLACGIGPRPWFVLPVAGPG
jgi:hypothetical protein